MRPWHCAVALAFATASVPSLAAADDTIKTPGDHPKYVVELEPQGLLGFDLLGPYGLGFGAGLRASIPLMKNGFVPRINNLPAITFGFEWLHFDGYDYCYNYAGPNGFYCGHTSADTFYFPVGLQWNFFVARRWSVFAEVGVAPLYRSYPDYCGGLAGPAYNFCRNGEGGHLSFTPWGDVGARFHFNEHVALTMRLGAPSLSVGVSFML